MSSSEPSQADNSEAISPDAAAVIARARRSFGFSIGLLLLGFVAVALALVYRTGGDDGTVENRYVAGVLAVPSGATIVSAVPAEGMIAVTYTLEDRTKLRLIDGSTGAIIRDIEFVSE